MKRGTLYIFSITLLLFVSCGSKSTTSGNENKDTVQQPTIRNISSQELSDLLKTDDIQLIDVRTPEEVAAGSIEGSQHVDIYDPEFSSKIEKFDRNKPIVLYCAAGGRSAKGGETALKLGFKEVINVAQGYRGWKSEGFPVIEN